MDRKEEHAMTLQAAQASDTQRDDAGILLHGSVSGSMAEGADLEAVQTSAEYPSYKG